MDLFTTRRKEILQVIAQEKSSASQIAKQVNLSLPYTLSQLAILEAANQIKKEKSSQKAYGKPRLIYSINKEFIELLILTKSIGIKKNSNNFTKEMKMFLEVMSSLPSEIQNTYSKYFWSTQQHQIKITAIGCMNISKEKCEFIALTTKNELENLRKEISHYKEGEQSIACWVHSKEELILGIQNNDSYYLNIKKSIKPLIDENEVFTTIKRV
jgi:predicted transcriptional regulator